MTNFTAPYSGGSSLGNSPYWENPREPKFPIHYTEEGLERKYKAFVQKGQALASVLKTGTRFEGSKNAKKLLCEMLEISDYLGQRDDAIKALAKKYATFGLTEESIRAIETASLEKKTQNLESLLEESNQKMTEHDSKVDYLLRSRIKRGEFDEAEILLGRLGLAPQETKEYYDVIVREKEQKAIAQTNYNIATRQLGDINNATLFSERAGLNKTPEEIRGDIRKEDNYSPLKNHYDTAIHAGNARAETAYRLGRELGMSRKKVEQDMKAARKKKRKGSWFGWLFG